MTRRDQVFWAVKYSGGFYTGTWLTRIEAIQEHIEAFTGYSERGHRLSRDQRVEWEKRKAAGDRAVKVAVRPYKPKTSAKSNSPQ